MNQTQKQIKKLQAVAAFFSKFSYVGLVFAVLFFCVSMLPSLLPRPWLLQGVLSGFSIAFGYGFGALLSACLRWVTEHDAPPRVKPYAWRALWITGPVLALLFLVLGSGWQNEVRRLVGKQPLESRSMLKTLLVALIVGYVAIIAARGIRRLSRFVIGKLDRVLPRRVSIAVGVLLVATFFYWTITGLLTSFLITQANNIYRSKNDKTPVGISQSISVYRSGGEGSIIPWSSLGYQGRQFVGGGPSVNELTAFSGQPAQEPIRVYAGLKSAATPQARAQLAVAELQRAGAFGRKVLVLASTTGTGWLEPQSMDSLEYMYGGDTAIVAEQYSYLPSWISFLVDRENATDASQALFDAVYAQWSILPKETRPKLYAYGLSLGSFGGQTPYSGVNDLRLSIDGALFMGTPDYTRLWKTITDQRQPGTPEYLPVYDQAKVVRFAATNQQIITNQATWTYPRILYVQHASDPIVWFNFKDFISKPDWLHEARGPDVSSNVHWYPFVTGAQLAIDQFFSTSVPAGHGHNYYDTDVTAWVAVTNPPNWTGQKTQRLQSLIENYKVN